MLRIKCIILDIGLMKLALVVTVRNIIAILLLICPLGTLAQQLTKSQLRHDLEMLVENIITYNPALSNYNPDFEIQAAEVIAQLNGAASIGDCYKYINQIGALCNEGHFRVDTKKVFAGILNNSYRYLPVAVKILNGKLYVWRSFTAIKLLKQGDQILSINGRPFSEIINTLYKHIPTDGMITTYTAHKASDGFFWMYYFFVEQPDKFDIEYQTPTTNEIKKVSIAALDRKTQVKNLRNQPDYIAPPIHEASINDFYEFTIYDNYAYLKLKSFDFRLVEKYKIDSNDFYDEIFEVLQQKNIENLIVDVRNNTGGRKQFPNSIPAYINESDGPDIIRKSISWKGKKATKKRKKHSKYVYKGNIYGIVNGLTFSSGATFARHLKEYGNAIIIGEETGSRYEGFAAGSSQEITLTNSGIRVNIPRYHITFPPSKKQSTSNRGLIPDIEVITEINDLIDQVDKALETAMDLIKKS